MQINNGVLWAFWPILSLSSKSLAGSPFGSQGNVIVDHNSKHLIIWLGLGCVVIALCQLTDPKTINISESTLKLVENVC